MLLLKYLHNNSISMFSIVKPKHELPSLKLLSCTNVHRPSISKTNLSYSFHRVSFKYFNKRKNHILFSSRKPSPPLPPPPLIASGTAAIKVRWTGNARTMAVASSTRILVETSPLNDNCF